MIVIQNSYNYEILSGANKHLNKIFGGGYETGCATQTIIYILIVVAIIVLLWLLWEKVNYSYHYNNTSNDNCESTWRSSGYWSAKSQQYSN